ncbi:SAM-dependent methyltransferase [Sphingomonas sp.]|uniref:class I SAM-dependent methyltransferase n=1 Tax=Sphingomonas sp. TaxID=28214 RepID=UPI002BD129E4|nr:SAM-dependent methyltransferase [Sphingomonas sp.]HTG37657.1 SAM-dependent methyltransferase [Sphingomonas sp.]
MMSGIACAPSRETRRRALPDRLRFALAWLRDPAATAAIAPSGRRLAALITRAIDAQTGPVAELGPGTGPFTRALIERGVAEHDLTLVEYNDDFARLLRLRHPAATVLCADAAALAGSESPPGGYGAVVCGLGLRNMDAAQIEAIVGAAFVRMRIDGALYLFTYGRRCSVPDMVLDRLGLTAERVGTVWRNLPPARVYRVARR